MPKLDYPRNSVIYKISAKHCDYVYIGCHPYNYSLEDRLDLHRNSYMRWMDGDGGYCPSFYILLYDDCKIELIERGAKNKRHMNLRRLFWCIASGHN